MTFQPQQFSDIVRRIPSDFHQIPQKVLVGVGGGVFCAWMAGSEVLQWTKVSIISALADSLLSIIFLRIGGGTLNKKWTYLTTHGLVSIAEIIALRRLGLIGSKGTVVVSAYAIFRCIILLNTDIGSL